MKRLMIVLAMAIFLMSGSYAWAGNCMIKGIHDFSDGSRGVTVYNSAPSPRQSRETRVICHFYNGVWYCSTMACPAARSRHLPTSAMKAACHTCTKYVDY